MICEGKEVSHLTFASSCFKDQINLLHMKFDRLKPPSLVRCDAKEKAAIVGYVYIVKFHLAAVGCSRVCTERVRL